MCFAANRDLPSAGFRTWSTRGIWANAQMFHEIERSGVAKIALVIGVRPVHFVLCGVWAFYLDFQPASSCVTYYKLTESCIYHIKNAGKLSNH